MKTPMKVHVVGDKAIIAQFEALGKAGAKALTRATTRIAMAVQKRARTKIMKGPKTGATYAKSKTVNHRASAPGEAPANDTGNLQRSIHVVAAKPSPTPVAIVETSAPYARALEYGYKKRNLEPRPFLEPSLREVSTSGEAAKILQEELDAARKAGGTP